MPFPKKVEVIFLLQKYMLVITIMFELNFIVARALSFGITIFFSFSYNFNFEKQTILFDEKFTSSYNISIIIEVRPIHFLISITTWRRKDISQQSILTWINLGKRNFLKVELIVQVAPFTFLTKDTNSFFEVFAHSY